MFRTLVLQASHNLSDERTEYLIRDRLSFMRFLGLGLADTVPDANTIWTFREALTRANARKSAVRSAVEHVFARQKGPMSLFIRTIGIARATTKIGLANLVYNMQRAVWLTAQAAPT